jgi:hypothetical protein
VAAVSKLTFVGAANAAINLRLTHGFYSIFSVVCYILPVVSEDRMAKILRSQRQRRVLKTLFQISTTVLVTPGTKCHPRSVHLSVMLLWAIFASTPKGVDRRYSPNTTDQLIAGESFTILKSRYENLAMPYSNLGIIRV